MLIEIEEPENLVERVFRFVFEGKHLESNAQEELIKVLGKPQENVSNTPHIRLSRNQ